MECQLSHGRMRSDWTACEGGSSWTLSSWSCWGRRIRDYRSIVYFDGGDGGKSVERNPLDTLKCNIKLLIVEALNSSHSIHWFQDWKHKVETMSNAVFTKDSNHGLRHYYWCSRGNMDRTKEESEMNRISKRTQRHCSAFINVSSRNFVDL